MNNGKILFIKFPEAWNYPLDSNLVKEFTTTFQIWDPFSGEYGEKMELYPGHFGEMTVMPNNQQVIVTGGHCFEKSDESKLFKLTAPADMHDFLAKCQSIELIDLKNKTRKQIGRVPFSTKFKAVYGLPVLVDTQRILYVGGRYTDAPTHSDYGPYRDMALFNIKTGKTRFVGRTDRDGSKIESWVRFSDGSVAVVTTSSLYLFDQATETFKKVDDLITFPAESAAVASPDDKLYIVGGYGGGDPRLIQMFDYRAYLKVKGKKAS